MDAVNEVERARWWVSAWARHLSYLLNHPITGRDRVERERKERQYLYECERSLYKHQRAHERLQRATGRKRS